MPIAKYFLVTLIMALLGCQLNSRPTAEALFYQIPPAFDHYQLKKPDAKYLLPYVLEEISGLAYFSPGVLACVQDEEGKFFLYNCRKRKIEQTIRFGDAGDYEGIATNGKHVFVVESSGDVFRYAGDDSDKKPKVKKYKTPLSKRNDVEGVTFDPELNGLILACKEAPDLHQNNDQGRAFYLFDVDKKEIDDKPLFVITPQAIKAYLETYKQFEYETNRLNFKPSGIALHPINKHYYVIASVGKLLLIVDKNGKIKGSMPLDPRLLGQPEGICFAPNGDMFISSEGQGDKGYILKFSMKS